MRVRQLHGRQVSGWALTTGPMQQLFHPTQPFHHQHNWLGKSEGSAPKIAQIPAQQEIYTQV